MTIATTATAVTVSRRAWLSRLLLATAVAPVAGVRLADSADASKKGKRKPKSIKQRVQVYQNACETAGEAGGGTAEVTKRPGGTTVACTGSRAGDWACTVSSKTTRCHATRTTPPDSRPIAPVTGGDEPTGGTSDGGNGDQPWQHDDLPILEPVEGGGSEPPLL